MPQVVAPVPRAPFDPTTLQNQAREQVQLGGSGKYSFIQLRLRNLILHPLPGEVLAQHRATVPAQPHQVEARSDAGRSGEQFGRIQGQAQDLSHNMPTAAYADPEQILDGVQGMVGLRVESLDRLVDAMHRFFGGSQPTGYGPSEYGQG